MKQIIITLIITIISLNVHAQTVTRHYKTFKDSSYKAGDIILAPEIAFALGSCGVIPPSKDSVKVIAEFLKKHPAFKIESVFTQKAGAGKP
jgi:hypothetical protein